MAASAVELCNLALVRLGFEPVQALSDTNDRARTANRLYESTRDELLRAHNWNFAQTRVGLAQLATDPDWGELFAFQLPTDCLMVLETNLSDDAPWRIEGRTLVTAEPAVSILYVARITDPAQFDVGFTEALVDRLAFHFSYPLTRNAALGDLLLKKADDSFRRAKSRDGQEGRALKRWASDAFTKVR